MDDSSAPKEFGKFRAAVWPIHGWEMKKFLPMSMMMFCILFVYTLVRDLKDTLIANAPGSGAKYISPLKLWGVLPFAMLAVALFSKSILKFGFNRTFYVTVTSFLSFYAIFGFILHKNASLIHFSKQWIEETQAKSPPVIDQLIPLIGNWSFSLFYIISEIWGSLVISSLFWQFANKTTMKSEVKRYYGLFACIGNLALIVSGSYVQLTAIDSLKEHRVLLQMIAVLIMGTLIMVFFSHINSKVLIDKRFFDPSKVKAKKEKKKIGLGESLKAVFKSKYLLLITVLVLAYGIAINISEVVWKEQGKAFYGSENEFNKMMGNLSIVTGIVTIIVTLTCSNILRKCSWKFAALVTPLSVLILGGMFFILILVENAIGRNTAFLWSTVIGVAVWVGLVQDAIAKGIKYSLFDSTKQMAYIPLDHDLKTTGQAAVEVVGGRAGKSAGSVIIIVLTSIFGTSVKLSSLVPILSVILFLVCGMWIFSTLNLSKKYEDLKNKRKEEDIEKVTEKIEETKKADA